MPSVSKEGVDARRDLDGAGRGNSASGGGAGVARSVERMPGVSEGNVGVEEDIDGTKASAGALDVPAAQMAYNVCTPMHL